MLTAPLGGDVYDYDQIPGSPQNSSLTQRTAPVPDLFAAVAVDRRYVPVQRRVALPGRSSWRLSVRCVGRTVREAQWVQDRTQDALDGATLTVDGFQSTPLLFESNESPVWDDGRYSCEIVYTYTC